MKYIPAEKLIAEIERLKGLLIRGACAAQIEMETNCKDEAYNEVLSFITYLQQQQPINYIEINGIRYKEVPAKTDDKICKECDYFLDNGCCDLDDCPCACADNILERIQQQPEMDLEKEIEEYFKGWTETDEGIACYYQYVDLNTCRGIARNFYELGKARKKK